MLLYYKYKKYLDKSAEENKKHAKCLKCLDGKNICENLLKDGFNKYFCKLIDSPFQSIMEIKSCPAKNRIYERWCY